MNRYKFVSEDALNGYILDTKDNYIVTLCNTKRPDLKFDKLKELVEMANFGEEKYNCSKIAKMIDDAPDECLITGLNKCESYIIGGNVVYLTNPAYDAYTLPDYDRDSLSFLRIKYDMDDDFREENEHLCDLSEILSLENFEKIKEFYKITDEEMLKAIKEKYKDNSK